MRGADGLQWHVAVQEAVSIEKGRSRANGVRAICENTHCFS